ELEFQRDSGDDAERETEGENLGPEPRHLLIMVIAGHESTCPEVEEQQSQSHGQLGKEVVERHRDGKLKPIVEQCAFHSSLPLLEIAPCSSLFHHQLVHVAPSPTFPWFNGADDGMAGRVKVFRGVLVLRGIAAADVPTDQAHSQMDPAVLHFQTLLAAEGARLDVADLVEMGAGLLGHDHTSLRYSCTNWTAIAPSPTAEATRLTESDRTSPAANTPARLVSSRNGCRLPIQCGDCASDGPVMMKPLASR